MKLLVDSRRGYYKWQVLQHAYELQDSEGQQVNLTLDPKDKNYEEQVDLLLNTCYVIVDGTKMRIGESNGNVVAL